MTTRLALSTLVLAYLTSFAAQPAAAVPAFTCQIKDAGNGTNVTSGTTSCSGNFELGGSYAGGTVDTGVTPASLTSILIWTYAFTALGSPSPLVDALGIMEYFDVVFTDVNNPGAAGSIQVSANYLVTQEDLNGAGVGIPNLEILMGLGVSSSNLISINYADTAPAGTQTTNAVTVDLNVPHRLYMRAKQRMATSSSQVQYFATASLALDSIPFNLPAGYTADSVDAGIIDNSLDPPIAVPALSPLGLGILCVLLVLSLWLYKARTARGGLMPSLGSGGE
jgi:hypothetical protein